MVQKSSSLTGTQLTFVQAHWSSSGDAEYGAIATQISSIQNVLIENIDILLERGERLDLLVSRAKTLATESSSFRRQSYRLQQSTEWLPVRRIVMLSLVGVFVLSVYLVLAFSCGGLSLTNCVYRLPSDYNVSEPFFRGGEEQEEHHPPRTEALRPVDEFINELKTESEQKALTHAAKRTYNYD